MGEEGLYKLFHPAILNGRTWRTWRTQRTRKRWKASTRWLRTLYWWFKRLYLWLKRLSICDSKGYICDSKHSNFQPDDSNIKFWGIYGDSQKVIKYALENTIMGHLKMGEHQVKYRALATGCPLVWARFSFCLSQLFSILGKTVQISCFFSLDNSFHGGFTSETHWK